MGVSEDGLDRRISARRLELRNTFGPTVAGLYASEHVGSRLDLEVVERRES